MFVRFGSTRTFSHATRKVCSCGQSGLSGVTHIMTGYSHMWFHQGLGNFFRTLSGPTGNAYVARVGSVRLSEIWDLLLAIVSGRAAIILAFVMRVSQE